MIPYFYRVVQTATIRIFERGGVGGVGGPGTAKVLFNEKIVCSPGPGAMKYPGARTGSRRPWLQ